eukprot:s3427_g3.t1
MARLDSASVAEHKEPSPVIRVTVDDSPTLCVVDEATGRRIFLDDMEGGPSPGGSTVASATLLNSAMAEVLKDFLPVRKPMVIQWAEGYWWHSLLESENLRHVWSFQFCGCRSPWAEAMATRSRSMLAVAAVLVLLALSHDVLSFSLGSSIGAAEAKASDMLTSLQRGVAGVLAVTSVALVNLIVMIIPGLAVLLLGWAGYRIYTTGSYNYRTFLGLGIALGLPRLEFGGLTYGLICLGERFQSPDSATTATASATDAQGQLVRSGELVLLQSGEAAPGPKWW